MLAWSNEKVDAQGEVHVRFESSAQTPGSSLDHVNVTGILLAKWRSFLTWKEPSRVGICFVSIDEGE